MRLRNIGMAAIVAFGLSACGNTDGSQALTGAAMGGVGALAVGGSTTLGIVVGGALGILCDDVSPSYCL